MKGKHLSEETKSKMVRLYGEGVTAKDIGRRLGVDGSHVSKILRSRGTDVKRVGRPAPRYSWDV